MSAENPFKPLSPEAGESKESHQGAVDALYDALAPYHAVVSEAFSDAMQEQARDAMDVLLSEEVSRRLGEKYKVTREGDYFYLASPQGVGSRDTLGVFAEERSDLPSGKITVHFDVKAMSKERDGWDERYFDAPVVEDARLELTASPDAMKNVYDKLEAEYAKEVEQFERKSKVFAQLADWVAKPKGKRLNEKSWNDQPLLKELWPWAEGAECEIVRATSANGKEELQLIIFDGDQVRDIVAEPKPKKPERWF